MILQGGIANDRIPRDVLGKERPLAGRMGKQSMSYPGWDKHVAISGAKEMAKQARPSKVVIHDRKGAVQKEIPYEAK